MIVTTYIFIVIFFSIFSELIFGYYGAFVPFTALAVYYISVVYDLKTGIFTAVIAGFVLDILLGRILLISPLVLILVVFFAKFWLYHGILKSLHLQIFPGIVVSIIYAVPLVFINYYLNCHGLLLFLYKILNIITAMGIGCIFLPIVVLLLDSISIKLNLNQYTKAKEQLKEHS